MAISLRSTSIAVQEHGGNPFTLDITKPAGTAAGDLLVAVMGINGSAAGFSLSGWTTLWTEDTGSNYGARCLVKVAGGSEPATYQFDVSGFGGDGMAGVIACFSSSGDGFIGSDNVFDYSAVTNGAATNHSFSPGITPIGTTGIFMHGSFVIGAASQSTYAITNNNPTWTEQEDDSDSSFTRDAGIALATATPSAASATGNFTLTLSASQGAIGFLMYVDESTDASVTGTVGTLTIATNTTGSVAADANVTGSVGTLTISPNTGTATTSDGKVTNQDKSSAPSVTNQAKS